MCCRLAITFSAFTRHTFTYHFFFPIDPIKSKGVLSYLTLIKHEGGHLKCFTYVYMMKSHFQVSNLVTNYTNFVEPGHIAINLRKIQDFLLFRSLQSLLYILRYQHIQFRSLQSFRISCFFILLFYFYFYFLFTKGKFYFFKLRVQENTQFVTKHFLRVPI